MFLGRTHIDVMEKLKISEELVHLNISEKKISIRFYRRNNEFLKYIFLGFKSMTWFLKKLMLMSWKAKDHQRIHSIVFCWVWYQWRVSWKSTCWCHGKAKDYWKTNPFVHLRTENFRRVLSNKEEILEIYFLGFEINDIFSGKALVDVMEKL